MSDESIASSARILSHGGAVLPFEQTLAEKRREISERGDLADATLTEQLRIDELPQPDLALWLRLPVALALERAGSTAVEPFEKAAFLERVNTEYERMGLVEVDASGTIQEVEETIRALMTALVG